MEVGQLLFQLHMELAGPRDVPSAPGPGAVLVQRLPGNNRDEIRLVSDQAQQVGVGQQDRIKVGKEVFLQLFFFK